MDEKLQSYLKLNKTFEENGFSLFLVGGTVRDFLLGIPLTDMDVVTDATPDQMKNFLPDASYAFAKYGSISFKDEKRIKFDITTLRKEKSYLDSRHPGNIEFVKELDVDVIRRDFTINALYLDKNLKVIDLVGGVDDLNKHILRMVGDPKKRLNEDPLRIIRAFRFAIDYDLSFDKKLDAAIRESISLINRLNPDKIKQDLKKMKCQDKDKIDQLFNDYGIKELSFMIE